MSQCNLRCSKWDGVFVVFIKINNLKTIETEMFICLIGKPLLPHHTLKIAQLGIPPHFQLPIKSNDVQK